MFYESLLKNDFDKSFFTHDASRRRGTLRHHWREAISLFFNRLLVYRGQDLCSALYCGLQNHEDRKLIHQSASTGETCYREGAGGCAERRGTAGHWGGGE